MSTYSAWWREVGASEWTEVSSEAPITWTQEIEKGKCLVFYNVTLSKTYQDAIGYWHWRLGFVVTGWQTITLYQTKPVYGPIQGLVFRYWAYLYAVTAHIESGVNGGVYTPYDFSVNPDTVTRRNEAVAIHSIVRQDGQPDNCGNCITTFSTGLIISRPQCIEVTLIPPECPCCGDMLPGATRILNRLQGMIA